MRARNGRGGRAIEAAASRFRGVFEKGQQKLIELCWNGEYFQQHLPGYEKRPGEVGPGCMADQLIGQWWAHQLGLGYILPREKVMAALRAVFKYNFMSDLTGWPHAPRGLRGGEGQGPDHLHLAQGWAARPRHALLRRGLDRHRIPGRRAHDLRRARRRGPRHRQGRPRPLRRHPRPPIQRNPWNEIECGDHYARAMSSGSFLPLLAGWEYDGPRQAVRFMPRHTPEKFKAFFATRKAGAA